MLFQSASCVPKKCCCCTGLLLEQFGLGVCNSFLQVFVQNLYSKRPHLLQVLNSFLQLQTRHLGIHFADKYLFIFSITWCFIDQKYFAGRLRLQRLVIDQQELSVVLSCSRIPSYVYVYACFYEYMFTPSKPQKQERQIFNLAAFLKSCVVIHKPHTTLQHGPWIHRNMHPPLVGTNHMWPSCMLHTVTLHYYTAILQEPAGC